MKRWHVAGVALLALAGLWVAVLAPWGGRDGRGEPERDEPRLAPAPPATRAAGAWPIFRGSQALTGVAGGRLADELRLLWRFKTGAEVKSSPVIHAGSVYVGSSDYHVYALDLARGTKRWAYKTDDAVEAPPLVLDGKVYAGSVDGSLYALDAAAGRLVWKHATEAQIIGSANWFRGAGGRLRVVVGSHDNKLYCLDAAGGKLLWTYESENFINGAPTVGGEGGVSTRPAGAGRPRPGGRILFGGCDALLHVVAFGGERLRTIDVGSYVPCSAALAGGRAFVGNHEGKLLCADVNTGRIVWTYDRSEGPFMSSPAVGADRVVAGSGDGVHCVDRKTGKRIWAFATGGTVDSSPVICDGRVVFGCDDGTLYVVRLADGKKTWSYEVGEGISSSPAVVGGTIVVGGLDGRVYAFGP